MRHRTAAVAPVSLYVSRGRVRLMQEATARGDPELVQLYIYSYIVINIEASMI